MDVILSPDLRVEATGQADGGLFTVSAQLIHTTAVFRPGNNNGCLIKMGKLVGQLGFINVSLEPVSETCPGSLFLLVVTQNLGESKASTEVYFTTSKFY